jgi:hypothetical protein
MDLQHLEKKIIYLKGVQNGILQGSNPNISKYKMHLDFEISTLEKQFQQIQNQGNEIKKTLFASKNQQKPQLFTQLSTQNSVLKQDEEKNNDSNTDLYQFQEVSKKINQFKEQIFHNNNQMQLLNRNKTYQNTLQVQNIYKQNNLLYLQIQKYQSVYDILHLKINNPTLYKNKYGNGNENREKSESINIESPPVLISSVPTPKSILKKSDMIIKSNKHIQINTAKNSVQEFTSKPIQKPLQFLKKSNQEVEKRVIKEEKDGKEENDSELMKEFQSTLGVLQKLLI